MTDREIYILPKSGQAGARKVVRRLRDAFGVELLYPATTQKLRKPVLKAHHTHKKIFSALLPNVPFVLTSGTGVNYRCDRTTGRYTTFFGEHSSISDLLHDIAHWMMAGKITRRRAEYGLGESPDDTRLISNWDFPDSYSLPYPQRVKGWAAAHKISQTVEMYSSALGIAMEYSLGLDYLNTVSYHNWDQYNDLIDHWCDLEKYCGGSVI